MVRGHWWERLALEQERLALEQFLFLASVRGVVVLFVGPFLSLLGDWMLQRPPHKTSTQRGKRFQRTGCLTSAFRPWP